LPLRFGEVHAERRTPHIAILALFLVAMPLALFGTIAELAAATVLLLLLVFAVVNAALFVLKCRPGEPHGSFEIPLAIPAFGALVCLALVVVRVGTGDWKAPAVAGVLLLASALIYALVRPKPVAAAP
jgi:amino acid transporter